MYIREDRLLFIFVDRPRPRLYYVNIAEVLGYSIKTEPVQRFSGWVGSYFKRSFIG
jgi:hypothetical protein